jgi:hypothetical protein
MLSVAPGNVGTSVAVGSGVSDRSTVGVREGVATRVGVEVVTGEGIGVSVVGVVGVGCEMAPLTATTTIMARVAAVPTIVTTTETIRVKNLLSIIVGLQTLIGIVCTHLYIQVWSQSTTISNDQKPLDKLLRTSSS